ncbi:hypothetical protein [Butyrivibrio sp.]|uniref:hypothetical protein n=1 Tax=Butyrivibrio sp. TaxID=28121 RepID=UPI0025C5E499|nr:hypothetical protein [Butyrivibrio sp.]MBE5838375.1 hypothetical protein [Butyrivibrio sp.]
MKCPSCGAEIGDSTTCEFCGTHISLEMKKEQEQLNKKGCPKCGSSSIKFTRENQGEIRGKNAKQIVHRTVGFCQDCGHTWYPESEANEVPKKKNTIWWVLGWICFFPAPVMVLIWRKKNTWDIKIKIAVTVMFWLLIFVLGSNNNQTTDTQTTTNNTQIEETKETHIYDNAEIVDMMSGSGKNKIGTITVCHANKDDCSEEMLADWYTNFVKKNSDSKYHVIIYDDVDNKGVYSNGMGFVQKDIALTKGADGTYEVGDDAGSTMYTVNDDGTLAVQITMADESVVEPIKQQVDSIIPNEYKNSDIYMIDVAGAEGELDCNITLVSDTFENADLQSLAVDLGTQVKALDLGIKYFSIVFQKDDYTLTAISSVDDLSTQEATEITTNIF